MKIKYLYILLFVLMGSLGFSQERAYQLYNSNGKKLSYKKMIKGLERSEVILFGELHNNPICHWLQQEVTKSLINSSEKKAVLGAEFFERDDQIIINEYLQGNIKLKHLKKEAKVWDNFDTDYEPLLKLAKENSLEFIATNIPRRYASIVSRNGLNGLNELSDEAKLYMMPLPVEVDTTLKSYRAMLAMGHGMPMNPMNMLNAQAVKDATMAHFIIKCLDEGNFFLHFNGAYHSDVYEGIYHWIQKYSLKDILINTISTVEQKDINKLDVEYFGRADFIICVDDDVNKSY
jgi:uncharacterized iron-regulated protein